MKAWAEYVNLGGCNDEVEEEEEEEDEDDEKEEKVIRHCVDKVYTKAHMKHFRWAIEDTAFDEDWDYSETQLDCMVGDELQPDVVNPEKKTEKKPEKKTEKKAENIKEKLKGLKKINKDSSHFVKCVNKISKEFDETTSTVEQEFDKLREREI